MTVARCFGCTRGLRLRSRSGCAANALHSLPGARSWGQMSAFPILKPQQFFVSQMGRMVALCCVLELSADQLKIFRALDLRQPVTRRGDVLCGRSRPRVATLEQPYCLFGGMAAFPNRNPSAIWIQTVKQNGCVDSALTARLCSQIGEDKRAASIASEHLIFVQSEPHKGARCPGDRLHPARAILSKVSHNKTPFVLF